MLYWSVFAINVIAMCHLIYIMYKIHSYIYLDTNESRKIMNDHKSANNFIPKPGSPYEVISLYSPDKWLEPGFVFTAICHNIGSTAAIKLVCIRDLEPDWVLLKHIYHASSLQANYELRCPNCPNTAVTHDILAQSHTIITSHNGQDPNYEKEVYFG